MQISAATSASLAQAAASLSNEMAEGSGPDKVPDGDADDGAQAVQQAKAALTESQGKNVDIMA